MLVKEAPGRYCAVAFGIASTGTRLTAQEDMFTFDINDFDGRWDFVRYTGTSNIIRRSDETLNRGPSYLVLYARGSKRHRPGGKGVTCVWTLILS